MPHIVSPVFLRLSILIAAWVKYHVSRSCNLDQGQMKTRFPDQFDPSPPASHNYAGVFQAIWSDGAAHLIHFRSIYGTLRRIRPIPKWKLASICQTFTSQSSGIFWMFQQYGEFAYQLQNFSPLGEHECITLPLPNRCKNINDCWQLMLKEYLVP